MILSDPAPFLRRLFGSLQQDGIDVEHLELDHICYRVADLDRYEELKTELGEQATLFGEHEIGGRAIATYELHDPIVHQGRSIRVVELPAPKVGSPYAEGWEHAEFVVNEAPLSFAERYPDLQWDRTGTDKSTNADVRLGYDGFSVKFHQRSLAEVIALERSIEP